jgi:hypothetical protein
MLNKSQCLLSSGIFLSLVLVGCILSGCDSETGKASENQNIQMTPSAESQGGKGAPGGPMSSQTFDNPTEEKLGSTTMKDLSVKAGLDIYPGSEDARGESFKRSDSGTKYVVTFETSATLEILAEFYKKSGFDSKMAGDQMTSMGMTKKDSQVIISATKQPSGKSVVKITSLIYPKSK